MDSITVNVEALPVELRLGYTGENIVGQVLFDYSAWAEEFGEGTLGLVVKRSQDPLPYPALLDAQGRVAAWTLTAVETHYKGWGEGQVTYIVDDAIKKSSVFTFFIRKSLGNGTDPPDAYGQWIEQLLDLSADTQANATAAAGSADEAESARILAEAARDKARAAQAVASQRAHAAEAAAADAWAAAGGYMSAEIEDEHLIITITNCDQLGFSLVDERLVITYG